MGLQVQEALSFVPPALLIPKYANEYGVSEDEAADLFEETKKFLVKSVQGGEHTPTRRLDMMWHMFILFTEDYHNFSSHLGGYVHHRPTSARKCDHVCGGGPAPCCNRSDVTCENPRVTH